ncbi:MAG TPA: hypothetical protein VEH58_06095, partial [Dehalococcoidales bacterium]|nr:hypothetical protein [Dehalococcoidales bacterium]
MKITRSFYAPISEATASSRAVDFLAQAGYKRLPDSGGCLHFKRGSIMGTLTNFNPTSWTSAFKVRLTSEGNLARIELETAITSDPFERRFAKEL